MLKTLLTLAALLLPTAFAQTAPTVPTMPTTTTPAHPAASAPLTPVNVNTASPAQLATLPGVSSKIAANIIKNRPYKNSDELVKKVNGIGKRNVKKMLPYLAF